MMVTVVISAAKFTVNFLFSLVTCVTMVMSAAKVTFDFLFDVVVHVLSTPSPHKKGKS
jgi:hypothetical protein